MNATDLLEKIGVTLGATASVKSVFGEPISANGKTVVPVAKLAYGFGGGFGGDLRGFDLEDAELGGVRGIIGVLAERAFCETWPGSAGGDELAGELDEVGGDLDRGTEVFEDRRLAEGDLFVERFGFGWVDDAAGIGGVRVGQGRGGVFDLIVETDGEAFGGGDGCGGDR